LPERRQPVPVLGALELRDEVADHLEQRDAHGRLPRAGDADLIEGHVHEVVVRRVLGPLHPAAVRPLDDGGREVAGQQSSQQAPDVDHGLLCGGGVVDPR